MCLSILPSKLPRSFPTRCCHKRLSASNTFVIGDNHPQSASGDNLGADRKFLGGERGGAVFESRPVIIVRIIIVSGNPKGARGNNHLERCSQSAHSPGIRSTEKTKPCCPDGIKRPHPEYWTFNGRCRLIPTSSPVTILQISIIFLYSCIDNSIKKSTPLKHKHFYPTKARPATM
jgi:hypothetical protein